MSRHQPDDLLWKLSLLVEILQRTIDVFCFEVAESCVRRLYAVAPAGVNPTVHLIEPPDNLEQKFLLDGLEFDPVKMKAMMDYGEKTAAAYAPAPNSSWESLLTSSPTARAAPGSWRTSRFQRSRASKDRMTTPNLGRGTVTSPRRRTQGRGSNGTSASAVAPSRSELRPTGSSRAPVIRATLSREAKTMSRGGSSSAPTGSAGFPSAIRLRASNSGISQASWVSTRTRRSRNQTPLERSRCRKVQARTTTRDRNCRRRRSRMPLIERQGRPVPGGGAGRRPPPVAAGGRASPFEARAARGS